MKAYAGIGSRRAPPEVLSEMKWWGMKLAGEGYALRSGHARGADLAFEAGALFVGGRIELYLPWPGFNSEHDTAGAGIIWKCSLSFEAYAIAAKHHHHFARNTGTAGVRALMARNVHQVLGAQCDDPVRFVLCWTPDGAERDTTKATGGTGQAVRVAVAHTPPIPVINMAREGWRARLDEVLRRDVVAQEVEAAT